MIKEFWIYDVIIDGVSHAVEVQIDTLQIARDLARKARDSRTKQATMCGGAVVVKIKERGQ